jgi:competence ComEA-like helix-hairpin-helix protein
MKQQIKDFLTFSKKEQRGLAILSCLIFMVILANALTPLFSRKEKFDFSAYEKEIEAFYRAVDTVKLVHGRKDQESGSHAYVAYGKYGYPKPQSAIKNELVIEINSADSATLDKLKGIGPKFAQRIIKYRNLLGGFYCKEQLFEVYGMDSARLLPIWSNISIDTGLINKLNINKASFGDLLKHPYIEITEVKAITSSREKSGSFHSVNELLDLKLINDTLFRRLRPYLTVGDSL